MFKNFIPVIIPNMMGKGFPAPLNLNNRIKGQPINQQVRRSGQRPNVKRRNRPTYRKRSAGVEVNRAEGGYKSVTTNNRIVNITINTYGRLTYKRAGEDEFVPEFRLESDNYGSGDAILDVTNQLNNSNEFTQNRKRSEEYMVKRCSLTLDYNRIPQGGDRFTKLLLSTITDKVPEMLQTEMKKENNVMHLSMGQPGIKNYNTVLSKRTTNLENLNWQKSSYTWGGVWKIRVSTEDKTSINVAPEVELIDVATWKLSVLVAFRLTDIENSVTMNRMPTLIEINELKKELELLRTEVQRVKQEQENQYIIKENSEEEA